MYYFILGQGRHGKDEFADILKTFHPGIFRIPNTSFIMAEKVIFPALSHRYNSVLECYEDRHTDRQLWVDILDEYNKHDKARFIKEVFKHGNTYVGLRDLDQLNAFTEPSTKIWVDAEKRKGITEPMSITWKDADRIITNNTTLEAFRAKCVALGEELVASI